MRLSNEELIQEKIDLVEKESNDLDKIDSEKRQFEAIRSYTARPLYREPKTFWQRIQGRYREWRDNICPIHKIKRTEHGFSGQVDCPECRREYYEQQHTINAMKE